MKYTPFYELSPWPERFAAGWENMSTEHRKEYVRLSIEHGHIKEYYAAQEWMGQDGPRWEELTEDQKEYIRNENREHWAYMNKLGQAIAEGNI